ncbi:hypothetical protein HDU91_007531, partial [Kappamyces sp. JEL0680]
TPVSPATTSGDSPEVVQIMAMGFSKEQAVNALEIHSFQVDNAINYLLESTAK